MDEERPLHMGWYQRPTIWATVFGEQGCERIYDKVWIFFCNYSFNSGLLLPTACQLFRRRNLDPFFP